MRRGIGLVLIGLGTALLVLAPMLRFYAVPHRVLDEVDAELVAGLDLSQR